LGHLALKFQDRHYCHNCLAAKQDFGRVYLILSQNKAKICPIIVTMPTVCGV